MRVGLVIYGGLDTLSGGYLYDRKLVEYLQDQGDQVIVISLPWQNYLGHCFHNLNRKYLRQMVNSPVDIWLQDELNHPSLFWLNRRFRRINKTPLISIVHHLRSCEEHPRTSLAIYRFVEKSFLQSVDGFIFNSRVTRRMVEALLGRQAGGVIATPGGDRFGPGGISISQIEQRVFENGALRLLFVGNLIRRKGLHTLLRGLARLGQENWILEVVGRTDLDHEYTSEVKNFIRSKGLQERVALRGKISEQDLAGTLRRSHIMAMISSYEGFGIVYLEGMAFGLPAIASTAGGAGEIVQNGKTGWLVQPADHFCAAEKIRAYCQDRALLFEHSKNALSRFSEFPTWDQTVEKIRSHLLGVIGS